MKSKIFLCVMILLFAWTLCGPADVLARWDDESGDLPGMDDGGTKAVLIVGGVVIAGLLIYLLVKNSGDDDETGEDKSAADPPAREPALATSGSAGDGPPRSGADALERGCRGESGEMTVDPVILVKRDGLGAGLAITF